MSFEFLDKNSAKRRSFPFFFELRTTGYETRPESAKARTCCSCQLHTYFAGTDVCTVEGGSPYQHLIDQNAKGPPEISLTIQFFSSRPIHHEPIGFLLDHLWRHIFLGEEELNKLLLKVLNGLDARQRSNWGHPTEVPHTVLVFSPWHSVRQLSSSFCGL